jgi:DNA-binding protein H-NS
MDLSHYSIDELKLLPKAAERELDRRKKEQRNVALSELRKLANNFGFELGELVEGGAPAAKVESTKKVAPKYKHPTEELYWTGRGQKPVWFRELLESGTSIETLTIAQ